MSKSDRFSPCDTRRRQRHPLLAPFPPRPRQAGSGAGRRALHDSADRGAPQAAGRLEKTWIITNEFLAHEIADQLPGLPAGQIVQEPVARNTAPACGLAAFLIERQNPDACWAFSLRPRHRRRAALPQGAAKGHRPGRRRRQHGGAGH
jgi:hypothetical protein